MDTAPVEAAVVEDEPMFTLKTRSLDDLACCVDCALREWQREARRDVRLEIVDEDDLLDAPSFSAMCGDQLWEYYSAGPHSLSRLYCRWV